MEWKSVAERELITKLAERQHVSTRGIIIRGKLLIVSGGNGVPRDRQPPTRGEIKLFSKASRFNLLKKIATIDWEKLPMGLFVTLTFPDTKANVDNKTATMHRHHWIRDAETYLHEKIPILWRKEQKVRKSGQHEGLHVAHFHLCVFTPKHIPHALVRSWWAKTLQHEGPLATDVKRMDSGEHAAFYLAKYLSKRTDDPSLDYAPYLTKPGRAWGVHRPGLIPYSPVETIADLTAEQFDAIRNICRKQWSRAGAHVLTSFTLLGAKAEAAKKEIYELLS